MNNFLDKARTGRTNALADRDGETDQVLSVAATAVRFKTSRHYDPIPFISSRPQVQTSSWLH